jgi:hypothetical protein
VDLFESKWRARHPDQDGPDASKSIVDERANHHDFVGNFRAPSTSRFAQAAITLGPNAGNGTIDTIY